MYILRQTSFQILSAYHKYGKHRLIQFELWATYGENEHTDIVCNATCFSIFFSQLHTFPTHFYMVKSRVLPTLLLP